MIGRRPQREGSFRALGPEDEAVAPEHRELAFQWGIGCLVGTVALVGVFLLSLVFALVVQPPPWVQVVLALLLIAGAGALGWLVATAVGRARAEQRRSRR